MKAHGWGFFSRSTVFTTLMETSDVLNKGGDMPINLFSRWHWTWTESEPNKHTRRLRWKMYMHHCLYYCVLSVSQTGLCVLALWSLINEKISHRPQLTHIWSFSLHQPPKRLFYVQDQPSGGGPTLLRCLSVHLGVQSVVTSYPSYANISCCCCLTLTSKMQSLTKHVIPVGLWDCVQNPEKRENFRHFRVEFCMSASCPQHLFQVFSFNTQVNFSLLS